MRLDVERFLEDVSGRYAAPYADAVHEMMIGEIMNNAPKARAASDRLDRVTRETMGLGEVLGASLLLQAVADLIGSGQIPDKFRTNSGLIQFATTPVQLIVRRVTFNEAVEDMIKRTPVTIRRAAERTAQQISKLYGAARVVAFVKSAEDSVTREAQRIIARALREGVPEGEAGRRLSLGVEAVRELSKPWAESYSRMAFRTNLNTATTAGRFRQAQDQDIRSVVPAFRFDAVGDSDTRPNHMAADGLIFRTDNLVWTTIAPPLGYSCRCRVSLVSTPMLRRMGRLTRTGDVIEDRLPSDARPDAGFRHGGRPDLF